MSKSSYGSLYLILVTFQTQNSVHKKKLVKKSKTEFTLEPAKALKKSNTDHDILQ